MFLLNFKPGIHGRLGLAWKPSTGKPLKKPWMEGTSMMLFYWKVNILKTCISWSALSQPSEQKLKWMFGSMAGFVSFPHVQKRFYEQTAPLKYWQSSIYNSRPIWCTNLSPTVTLLTLIVCHQNGSTFANSLTVRHTAVLSPQRWMVMVHGSENGRKIWFFRRDFTTNSYITYITNIVLSGEIDLP